MNKKDYSVLIKEFSERLPHDLYFSHCGKVHKLKSIELDDKNILNNRYPIEICYPYLRPMLSMTEEERHEFSKLLNRRYCEEDWEGHISTSYCIEIDNVYTDDKGIIKYPSSFSMDAIDWLNEHHFDYRGLIEKGLAIEAPEGMYNIK